MSTDEELKAANRLLRADIASALLVGVQHFALDGTELITVEAVVDALRQDGKVILKSPATGEDP